MTDPLLDPDTRMTDFIRHHSQPNHLDGTPVQNIREQSVIDRHQRALAKIFERQAWYERQRRNHVLEAAGRMRAGAVGAGLSATVL